MVFEWFLHRQQFLIYYNFTVNSYQNNAPIQLSKCMHIVRQTCKFFDDLLHEFLFNFVYVEVLCAPFCFKNNPAWTADCAPNYSCLISEPLWELALFTSDVCLIFNRFGSQTWLQNQPQINQQYFSDVNQVST